jgi:hypothetical protein
MNIPFFHSLNLRDLCGKKVLQFFRRASKYVLLLLLLGIAAALGYFWYVSVYAYDWTEEQKNQYRGEYAGETSFREERFNRTIEVLKERISLHQTAPVVKKDIFFGTDL